MIRKHAQICAISALILCTAVNGKKGGTAEFWHGIDRDSTTKHIAESVQLEPAALQEALAFWKWKYDHHVPTWQPDYKIVSDIIRAHKCKIGCEVGLAFGTQSVHILEHTNVTLLHSIDPYIPYDNGTFPKGATAQWMDVLALIVKARLAQFGDRSNFIRATSLDAAAQFTDYSLDFVYVDGDHSYEAVSADLRAWYPKVTVGGILIGDDYTNRFPGLKNAVDEFVRGNRLKITHHAGGKYVIVRK